MQWESNSERYYDFINNLLYINWNLQSEEIEYTYLSLLKRISLDPDIVRFLFSPDSLDFPIYSAALKFWKHSDQLNIASCHTILLNIFKYADEEVMDYLINKKNATSTFLNSLVKDINSVNYSKLDVIDATLYFLKELMLLGKQSLSGSIREMCIQQVVDKIFEHGFGANDPADALWGIIIIGKMADILKDDVISKGIYNRLFGNYYEEGDSRGVLSQKWITFMKEEEGIGLTLAYSYLFYTANTGVFSFESEKIKQHLEFFVQKAFSCKYTPTLLLMICFKMSSTFTFLDLTPFSVTFFDLIHRK